MLPPINATSIPDRHINLCQTTNWIRKKFCGTLECSCVWSSAACKYWLTLSWSAEILNAGTNSRSFEDTILVSTPIFHPGNTQWARLDPQYPGTRYLWSYVWLMAKSLVIGSFPSKAAQTGIQNGSAHKSFNYGRAPDFPEVLSTIISHSAPYHYFSQSQSFCREEEVWITVPSEYFKALE